MSDGISEQRERERGEIERERKGGEIEREGEKGETMLKYVEVCIRIIAML